MSKIHIKLHQPISFILHKLGMLTLQKFNSPKIQFWTHIKLYQPALLFILHKLGMLTLQKFISAHVKIHIKLHNLYMSNLRVSYIHYEPTAHYVRTDVFHALILRFKSACYVHTFKCSVRGILPHMIYLIYLCPIRCIFQRLHRSHACKFNLLLTV